MTMLWFRVPQKIYFKRAILGEALVDLKNEASRAMIISDRNLTWLGVSNRVKKICQESGFVCSLFDQVVKNPTMEDLQNGLTEAKIFKPDLIIALGGGTAMNYSKLLRVFYENPTLKPEDICGSFESIRERLQNNLVRGGTIHSLVCVPTTSGTGDEVTPFARLTLANGQVELISDYTITPDMAVVDPEFSMGMTKEIITSSALYALSMAIESFVSIHASEFTEPYSVRASSLIISNFKTCLEERYNADAFANIHNAASLAGMASGNAFLGISHSLSHFITSKFQNVHPGVANAILLPRVIRFNANDEKTKKSYSKLAEKIAINLGESIQTKSDDEKINYLIDHVEELSTAGGIPTQLKDCGISEEEFKKEIDDIAARALADQGTACNPRKPTLDELKSILSQ